MTLPTVKLATLAAVSSGGSAPQDANAFSREGIPFIRAGSLIKLLEGLPEDRLELLQPEVAARYRLKLFPAGTVLFAKSGMSATKGHIYQLKKPAYVVSHLAALIPRSHVDGSYLRQVLRFKSPTSLIKDEAYPSIRLGEIEGMEVPAPIVTRDRERIAAILDQTDDLRGKRQRAIDRLGHLGQAIFHAMFGEASDIPENPVQLSSLLRFVTSGGRGWSKYYAESGTRFVRSLDVQMNFISASDAAFVAAPENAEARRTAVQPGDVLLTITGSKIGRVAPVPNDFGPAFVSQHVAILRIDQERVLPEYLSYYLSLPKGGQVQIAKNQYGQTKPGLNFDQIGRFSIPDVSIELQRDFVARIKNVASTIAQSEIALKQTEDLFSALQHRAFRGEL